MFTLLVSWLLVACVPGLLMLAALGLGRLEKELAHESVTATDVAAFLEQAEALDMRTLAREGMPEALEYLHRRQALQVADPPRRCRPPGGIAPRQFLPGTSPASTRRVCPRDIHTHSRDNPQFKATRRVLACQSCVALARWTLWPTFSLG
jgi:hypothetical protein